MSAINVTALAATLGVYARDHNFSDIVTQAFVEDDFVRKFDLQLGITNQRPMPNLTVGELSKPFADGSFDPNADTLAFDARILTVEHAKADLLIKPYELYNTWLGLSKTPGFDPKELPFEKFILDTIAKKIRDEVHLQMIYNGVKAAGTTPVDVMDGFLKLVADEITATNLTPVVTGAITVSNAVDSVEAMYDQLGSAYKKMGGVFRMSDTLSNLYKRNYRNAYGANTNYDEFDRMKVDGTNWVIEPDYGMEGSGRIIATPKDNFTLGMDLESDISDMEIQIFERSLKILTDYSIGAQFKEVNDNALVVNDQA